MGKIPKRHKLQQPITLFMLAAAHATSVTKCLQRCLHLCYKKLLKYTTERCIIFTSEAVGVNQIRRGNDEQVQRTHTTAVRQRAG